MDRAEKLQSAEGESAFHGSTQQVVRVEDS